MYGIDNQPSTVLEHCRLFRGFFMGYQLENPRLLRCVHIWPATVCSKETVDVFSNIQTESVMIILLQR